MFEAYSLAFAAIRRLSQRHAETVRTIDDQKARKRELARLAAGEIDVLIGTTILDVGVDFPAVGLRQLAGGGKAEVALRQRIGLGARRKKTGANNFFVSDYSTGPNSNLQGHARERRGIIEGTEGFRKSGAEHPWHLVATTKLAARAVRC